MVNGPVDPPGRAGRTALADVLLHGDALEDHVVDLLRQAQDQPTDPLARLIPMLSRRARRLALDSVARREAEGIVQRMGAVSAAVDAARTRVGTDILPAEEPLAELEAVIGRGPGSAWLPALHRGLGDLLGPARASFVRGGNRSTHPGAQPPPSAPVEGYRFSTDPSDVDIDVVHRYLSMDSYWATGRTREIVERSISGSAIVVTALDHDDTMVAFARVVTDRATFAWLADVFVLDDHRGKGLGEAVCRIAVEHPDVRTIKRHVLATADAHRLYERLGFEPLDAPERWMIRPGADP